MTTVRVSDFVGPQSAYECYNAEASAMIDWLTDKPQAVWLFVAIHNNWDFGVTVLRWMIEHPACDLAVAAQIFWMGNPIELAKSATGKILPASNYHDDEDILLARICEKSNLNRFLQSDLSAVDGEPKAEDWVPSGLTGPFSGLIPSLSANHHPETNEECWNLFNALGTKFERKFDPTEEPLLVIVRKLRAMENRIIEAKAQLGAPHVVAAFASESRFTRKYKIRSAFSLLENKFEQAKSFYELERALQAGKIPEHELAELVALGQKAGADLQAVCDIFSAEYDPKLRF